MCMTHGSELSLNDAESLNDAISSIDDDEIASITSGTGSPTARDRGDRAGVSDGEQQLIRLEMLPFTISVDGESLVAMSNPTASSPSLAMLQSSSATGSSVLPSGSTGTSNNEGESLTADQTVPVPAAALAFLEGSLSGAALCGPRKWSHRVWLAVSSANPMVGGLLLQYDALPHVPSPHYFRKRRAELTYLPPSLSLSLSLSLRPSLPPSPSSLAQVLLRRDWK